MADYASSYSSNYGPTMPSSQGPQGQQGASQQQNPQDFSQQYRAPLWSPPPGSTQQPTTGQQGQKQSVPLSQGMQTSNASGSPVQANGMIAPASAPAQGQPQSQGQTQQSQPTSPDPFTAMGGGFWTGQQWVPKDHPLAQQNANQPQPGQAPAQPTGAQPNPAMYSPYGPYPGRPDGTTYQPGQAPQYNFQPYQQTQFNPIAQTQAPTYQAGNISQFQAPDQSALSQQQQALVQQMMANPGWGPDAVNQMKASQKDTALSMQQQQQQALQGAAVGRGMLNSGFELGNERRLADTTQQNILGSYRDIDIANAQNTFQNQATAANTAENALTGQANRATQFYGAGLSGQQAQQGNLQAQAASGQNATQLALQQALGQFGVQQAQAGQQQNAFQNQFTAPNFQMQQFLSQQGLNQQGAASKLGAYQTDLGAFQNYQNNQNTNRQLDIQSQLGNAGIGVDQQKLQEQASEFGQNNQLNWAQLLNNMYMGRAGLGMDYATLQNTAQNQMMQQLFGSMLGGG